MTKKQAKIFQLKPPAENRIELLKKLDSKLLDGEFEYVIRESKSAIKRFPSEKFFYIIQSLAYACIKKNTEALKILNTAEKLFPDNSDVLYYLAKIHKEESSFDLAEEYFLKSLKHSPKSDHLGKAEILNDYAVLLRLVGRRKDAIKKLKLALKENRKDTLALHNYELFMKELKQGDLPLDDSELFQTIQIEEYFRDKFRKEFLSEHETKQVMQLIVDAWNKEVAPYSERLKNLSISEKSKWFRRVELNFSLVNIGKIENDDLDEIISKEDFAKTLDMINEALDFLPPDSILVLPLVQPLLYEAGLSDERVEDILESGKPTAEEEDILHWAVDVGFLIMDSVYEEDEYVKELIWEEAIDVAADYVPRIKSREMIDDLARIFEQIINLAKGNKKKSRKKR
jgi:tetratricopeptide (TPR) repeat protein